MRRLFVAALTLTLSGCALPPAIGVASLAADVASYFFSGKTLSDHGISALAQQDCALIRVMEGSVCEEYEDYEIAAATLEPLEQTDVQVAVLEGSADPIDAQARRYFAEDARLGATDVEPASRYTEQIAEIAEVTGHLAGRPVEEGQLADMFNDSDYLADDLTPAAYDG